MKLHVVMDGKFDWHDGQPYSSHMAYEPFLTRFLAEFSSVTVYARAFSRSSPAGRPVTGAGAEFKRLGDYQGLFQFIRQLPKLIGDLWKVSGTEDPLLLYMPGTLPMIAGYFRWLRGKPFFVFLVADPAEQLGAARKKLPVRIALPVFIFSTRFLVFRSRAALYVTQEFLQRLYPTRQGASSFATSDVYIPDDRFVREPRTSDAFEKPVKTLIYLAMMNQPYKGHDVLLQAFRICRDRGLDGRLILAGDGTLREHYESLRDELGLSDAVSFVGKVEHGDQFYRLLDDADLFVMSSRAEGLPRAMVEAMSRALPAISTKVGGIPELLAEEYLVPPDDPQALAERIMRVLADPDKLSDMSSANLSKSMEFRVVAIDGKMRAFYQAIKKLSQR